MSDRHLNIFLLFALIFIFILFSEAEVHSRIIIAFSFSAGLSLVAFIFNWLSIDGTVAAVILGTFAFGLGGALGAAVILSFFITSSILSKNVTIRKEYWERKFRRTGKQVWANGFWFTFWLIIWFLSQVDAFLVAAVSSIAMATADTWASEIGEQRLQSKTVLITSGENVSPGTDGAISFYGSLSAFCGAFLIALVFGGLYARPSISSILIIFLTGFTGCFIDSYIGARYQRKTFKFRMLSLLGYERVLINNNFVNWISAGIASLISLILILIIGI